VFPTRVGVNRFTPHLNSIWSSVPHASGGEPIALVAGMEHQVCSPREWG